MQERESEYFYFIESKHKHHAYMSVKCACQCGCNGDIYVYYLPEEKRTKPMLCAICEVYKHGGYVEHRLK